MVVCKVEMCDKFLMNILGSCSANLLHINWACEWGGKRQLHGNLSKYATSCIVFACIGLTLFLEVSDCFNCMTVCICALSKSSYVLFSMQSFLTHVNAKCELFWICIKKHILDQQYIPPDVVPTSLTEFPEQTVSYQTICYGFLSSQHALHHE